MTDQRPPTFRAGTDTKAREAALTEAARMLRQDAARLGEAQALVDEAHSASSLATMTLVHALALQVCGLVGEGDDEDLLMERFAHGVSLVTRQLCDSARYYFDQPHHWRDEP